MTQQNQCFDQLADQYQNNNSIVYDNLYKTTSIQCAAKDTSIHKSKLVESSLLDSSDGEMSSSGVFSHFTTPGSTPEEQSSIINSEFEAQLLFEKTISSLENNSFMKVYRSPQFSEVAINLYNKDEDIQNQWKRTLGYYRNNLKCNDDNRIQFELGECIGAIMNDERKIMIGLDSADVMKDLLINCMQICSEPDFILEIRVGLGGTVDPITLRIPAYAVAGIALLNRLLELHKTFSSNEKSLPGIIPTTMLRNVPRLTFFSAYTAAVKVNNLDGNIAKKTANDMLSYIKVYINKYHSNLTEYVRYEMDHSDTYQPKLLDHISGLFVSNCHDDTIRKALITQAETRGSDKEGSIKYASKHSIIFKDVIDINNSQSLFNPLNQTETNLQVDQNIYLADCIISIGGSVEERFGKVRQIIRQAFINSLQMNDESYYHLSLSIRMLSQAGQTPVYYHHKEHEITLDHVLNSNVIDIYENEKMAKSIKEDLLIITDDIGISILKPIWEHIPMIESSDVSSWENIVLTLIELCLKSWREHAKDENRTCQCSKESTEGVVQFFKHYDILKYLDDDKRSIIACIIAALEKQNRTQFGTNNSRPRGGSIPAVKETVDDPRLRSDSMPAIKKTTNSLRARSSSICASKETTNNINKQLDNILGHIFVEFIKTQIS